MRSEQPLCDLPLKAFQFVPGFMRQQEEEVTAADE
jgi:hypothetical protein